MIVLDIINRLDQPSWQTPLRYPQGPSLSVYFPFLAFTLISSSITNIQHSCEQFSRESDTGSPWTVTTGLLTQPSHNLSFGQRTVLLQQQQGSGGWCVKPVLDLVSFSFQDQLLSMHSCEVQLSQSACLWMCHTLPAWAQPRGRHWGLGPLGAWAGWFVAAGMGSPSEAAGRLVLSLAPLVTVAPLPMSHVMTQHCSKKWEIWSNTLLCTSLLPGEWLQPEPFGLCWPLSSQLLCQR